MQSLSQKAFVAGAPVQARNGRTASKAVRSAVVVRAQKEESVSIKDNPH